MKVLQNIFHGDKKTSCVEELFVTLANTAESWMPLINVTSSIILYVAGVPDPLS